MTFYVPFWRCLAFRPTLISLYIFGLVFKTFYWNVIKGDFFFFFVLQKFILKCFYILRNNLEADIWPFVLNFHSSRPPKKSQFSPILRRLNYGQPARQIRNQLDKFSITVVGGVGPRKIIKRKEVLPPDNQAKGKIYNIFLWIVNINFFLNWVWI